MDREAAFQLQEERFLVPLEYLSVTFDDMMRPHSFDGQPAMVWKTEPLDKFSFTPDPFGSARTKKTGYTRARRDWEHFNVTGEQTGEAYYYHGVLHREGDKPALTSGESDISHYYWGGYLHRDGDLPAVNNLYTQSPVSAALTIFYHRGTMHRDADAPAFQDDDCGMSRYYKHGELHRDGDLPAEVTPEAAGYYQHGTLHRDGDKPALIQVFDSLFPQRTVHTWYHYGYAHREGDKPAVVTWERSSPTGEDTLLSEKYMVMGKCHRGGDKPAVIAYKNGQTVQEEYFVHGAAHREGDKPALITERGLTWCFDGYVHREGDQPAVIKTDRDGAVVERLYYRYGLLHREGDKPARLTTRAIQYRRYGELHRDGDKPADIVLGDNPRVGFYQFGQPFRSDGQPISISWDGYIVASTNESSSERASEFIDLHDPRMKPLWDTFAEYPELFSKELAHCQKSI